MHHFDLHKTVDYVWVLTVLPCWLHTPPIRRDQLLEDSYNQLKVMDNERLKGRLRIAYVNEAGLAEAGIDGGGLFKDFMEELLKQGFSPQVGFGRAAF